MIKVLYYLPIVFATIILGYSVAQLWDVLLYIMLAALSGYYLFFTLKNSSWKKKLLEP